MRSGTFPNARPHRQLAPTALALLALVLVSGCGSRVQTAPTEVQRGPLLDVECQADSSPLIWATSAKVDNAVNGNHLSYEWVRADGMVIQVAGATGAGETGIKSADPQLAPDLAACGLLRTRSDWSNASYRVAHAYLARLDPQQLDDLKGMLANDFFPIASDQSPSTCRDAPNEEWTAWVGNATHRVFWVCQPNHVTSGGPSEGFRAAITRIEATIAQAKRA